MEANQAHPFGSILIQEIITLRRGFIALLKAQSAPQSLPFEGLNTKGILTVPEAMASANTWHPAYYNPFWQVRKSTRLKPHPICEQRAASTKMNLRAVKAMASVRAPRVMMTPTILQATAIRTF